MCGARTVGMRYFTPMSGSENPLAFTAQPLRLSDYCSSCKMGGCNCTACKSTVVLTRAVLTVPYMSYPEQFLVKL